MIQVLPPNASSCWDRSVCFCPSHQLDHFRLTLTIPTVPPENSQLSLSPVTGRPCYWPGDPDSVSVEAWGRGRIACCLDPRSVRDTVSVSSCLSEREEENSQHRQTSGSNRP